MDQAVRGVLKESDRTFRSHSADCTGQPGTCSERNSYRKSVFRIFVNCFAKKSKKTRTIILGELTKGKKSRALRISLSRNSGRKSGGGNKKIGNVTTNILDNNDPKLVLGSGGLGGQGEAKLKAG